MTQFHYQAENKEGEKSSGMVEAATENEAIAKLEKLGLQAIKVEPGTKVASESRGAIFSFEFRGQKPSGQYVQGKIDAPDALTAETRLRNEFGLDRIAVWGKKQVIKKTEGRETDAAEAMLKQFLLKKQIEARDKQAAAQHSFWSDVKSFIYWLLLIYAAFWFYATLAVKYPLGLAPETAAALVGSPLFVWILAGLSVVFFVLEMPHFLAIWQKETDVWRAIYTGSFVLLIILGVAKLALMIAATFHTPSAVALAWSQILNWPLALLIVLFAGSFWQIAREEKLYQKNGA